MQATVSARRQRPNLYKLHNIELAFNHFVKRLRRWFSVWNPLWLDETMTVAGTMVRGTLPNIAFRVHITTVNTSHFGMPQDESSKKGFRISKSRVIAERQLGQVNTRSLWSTNVNIVVLIHYTTAYLDGAHSQRLVTIYRTNNT
jgi:hypothetical protein